MANKGAAEGDLADKREKDRIAKLAQVQAELVTTREKLVQAQIALGAINKEENFVTWEAARDTVGSLQARIGRLIRDADHYSDV